MIKLTNNNKQWGVVSLFLHWLSAIGVIGLFVSGLWMVDLTYYSDWYNLAPHLHQSFGLSLFVLTLFRMLWRYFQPIPQLASHNQIENYLAPKVHWILYLLIIFIAISGYLISTAKGGVIQLFDWFELPAILYGYQQQETIAGSYHYWFAYLLIAMVLLHTLAALKHHFINKDRVLKNMLGL